ncbi:hypothetical protein PIB30_057087 [Stylosanthes scabra]|uniref:Uncharacterized protein n=1 Tax=Stylosanthes scabra TaxID=79078 RepID=A0ABU6TJC4_9FABA|nr:hypothetical protein [Stylosanthes scabra]
MEAMVKKAQPVFSTKTCCIYKAPHELRKLNEDAYTPKVVSIGPLHYLGNPRLVTMEAHKQVYCQHLFQRSEASVAELVSCVQELEPQIRACYSEKINLTADELVKVILIDCCFVIELFLEDEWMINDALFSTPWMHALVIINDLILLENQVPFFVIDKIYNLAFASQLNNGGEFSSFMSIAVDSFSYFNKQGLLPPAANSIAHFTDLLRYFYLPPLHRRPSRVSRVIVLGHSASELVEAGVKFMVNESSSSHGCLLDLEFKDGTLRIPHIEVSNITDEIWLRNMVALEQYHYPEEHYITDYVAFFAHILKTSKDTGVLIKAGIIDSISGGNYDSSVANLFGDVGKGPMLANTNVDYLKICDDLNAYYNDPWNNKMATLRRDYFTTPWKTAASIAAIVLLILTVIQTVCSILQVK